MKLHLDFDNDGDEKQRTWVVGLVLCSVILAEIGVIGVVIAAILDLIDLSPMR